MSCSAILREGRDATSWAADSFNVGVTDDDELAFVSFVRERGDHLLRYARLLIPDQGEAEDALQTALLRLTRHWSRRLSAPEAYVRRALVNLAVDRGRRRHLVARPVAVPRADEREAPDPADAVAARQDLNALLAVLPPRQRAAVILRIVEGMTEAETATLMGTSVGTVKSNLARGLAKCRTQLAGIARPLEGHHHD
jgi:RNA polymerase sigma-70 factor (sigma-E family)